MSTVRPTFGNIARRRIVPPKPPPKYVTWYVKLADRLHKGIVLTCVGVTVYYGIGVIYMFIQSRKNKGELRRRLIEAGVIDESGKQLLHRLKDEDSWLGRLGISKREDLSKKIEDKKAAEEAAAIKAEQDRLALEAANTDRTRIGIFDPSDEVVEANRRRLEEMQKVEDEKTLDPRVSVFYRDAGEKKNSWFGWVNWKTGEQKQVEAAEATAAASTTTTPSPTPGESKEDQPTETKEAKS